MSDILLEKINKWLQEQNAFDSAESEKVKKKIERELDVAHANVNVSKLGGNPTIMIKATLDPKSEWNNKILENSRYFIISFDMDNSKSNLEMVTKSHKIDGKKMKKQKAKNVDEAIKKINTWISKVK